MTKAIIGNVVGGHWRSIGIQTVTGAAGPLTLTIPSPTIAGPVQFITLQSDVTTWWFSDVTTVSPTTLNCQQIFPGQAPWAYAGDPTKIQVTCTTVAAKLNVHYYR